jgi:hypothetical protein
MTMLRMMTATLAVTASLLIAHETARAQGAPIPAATPQVVPTPAPGGTPVTFGPVKAIGSPLPSPPALPIATSVPTTSPNGHSMDFRSNHETFVVGDYLIQPKVYNELSHGQQSTQSYYALRGATEFNLGDLPFMIEGETRRYSYAHASGYVTNDGGASQSFVPAANELDTEIDGHLGIKILEPRIYIAASYLDKRTSASIVHVTGYGAGIEKLPDYGAPLGVYFSAYYYPNLNGQIDATTLTGLQLQTLRYRVLTYQLGFTIDPGKSPIFIDIGALGDRMTARGNSPSNETHLAPYAGIGFFSY